MNISTDNKYSKFRSTSLNINKTTILKKNKNNIIISSSEPIKLTKYCGIYKKKSNKKELKFKIMPKFENQYKLYSLIHENLKKYAKASYDLNKDITTYRLNINESINQNINLKDYLLPINDEIKYYQNLGYNCSSLNL